MSFFKGVGRTLGGFLGIRTGSSQQQRDFDQENQKKMVRDFWDARATETALRGQSEIQDAWDRATRILTEQEEQAALQQSARVELGRVDPTKRKGFFRFGV